MNHFPAKPHHHGALRAALIQAGIDILQSDGLQGLTLRKCAARAGVSHAAPAHHFDGLVGLKGAIAHHGLLLFRDAMLAASAGAADDLAQLKGICQGYLDFAAAQPALFRLMFGFEKHEHRKVSVELDGDLAYEVLREACAPFVRDDLPAPILEAQVWSLIHGYATLYLSGNFLRELHALPQQQAFEQVMAALDRMVTR
ncbi:TetR/AcrR family transcriptional regulator [Loktanella sp. D2R18]|uniref:TetR/AcrR family transcriptional regulator n=1 Tax=Rhodobacterales TaxID=204455 RepID=UPI000DE8E582|nr:MULTISPECIES: TetR-like C-terminal domain-containing protein [Rhodobacterales]MDO6590234.1 WHG domain-containing protein [Yoonia sp. 1_MG-2023]RBW42948.1 TetR/AcrR family transcriptional regulator [Loktanella sp. D2R18]